MKKRKRESVYQFHMSLFFYLVIPQQKFYFVHMFNFSSFPNPFFFKPQENYSLLNTRLKVGLRGKQNFIKRVLNGGLPFKQGNLGDGKELYFFYYKSYFLYYASTKKNTMNRELRRLVISVRW